MRRSSCAGVRVALNCSSDVYDSTYPSTLSEATSSRTSDSCCTSWETFEKQATELSQCDAACQSLYEGPSQLEMRKEGLRKGAKPGTREVLGKQPKPRLPSSLL